MKPALNVIVFILILSPFASMSQSDVDALRYSQTGIAGTARSISMAGAFGALGGDFSTLSWNPAGIAIYRKSEFTFSPSIYVENTKSLFQGNTEEATKYNFNFGNIGLVYTRKLGNDDNSDGWKNWNFGFGYNRLNNFHTSTLYEGKNSQNSMVDYFLDQANAIGDPNSFNPFYEQLAYYSGLIFYDTTSHQFIKDQLPGQSLVQRRTATTRGSIGDIAFSFGANYSNKLYLGATLGISTLRYEEESIYEEQDKNNNINYFNGFQFDQNVTTHGIGVNLKLGMIYRAADWLRLGAAFHTPTFYSMTDDYSSSLEFKSDNGFDTTSYSPAGSFDYNLTTPMSAIGSVAFIIGKMGLVSADYEFVDYTEPRFDASGTSFSDVNDAIQLRYAPTGNLKIGTEWRYDNFSFRAGYAMFGSPFASAYKISGADMSRNAYCIGLGIRDQDYFIDFGYVLTKGNEAYVPYSLSNTANDPSRVVPIAVNKISSSNFTITLGARF